MLIQVLSDLHMEFCPFTLTVNEKADVLVLAGDIIALRNKCDKLYHLENLIKNVTIPVVMVAGNHEYYGYGKVSETNAILKKLEEKYKNFHFLNNESWIHNDVEFIGSTLWSDFDIAESRVSFLSRIEQAISDFSTILSENTGCITAREMISLNKVARQYIDSAVRVNNGLKKVVVTHFVPSEVCIDVQYIGNALNPYFVCNCENLMVGVHTWIFAHTHSSYDDMFVKYSDSGHKMINTHLVCNPRGYRNENKNGFDKNKIIEV